MQVGEDFDHVRSHGRQRSRVVEEEKDDDQLQRLQDFGTQQVSDDVDEAGSAVRRNAVFSIWKKTHGRG